MLPRAGTFGCSGCVDCSVWWMQLTSAHDAVCICLADCGGRAYPPAITAPMPFQRGQDTSRKREERRNEARRCDI